MSTNKNNVDNYYIVAKLLMEFPEITPKQMDSFFELLSDWELLSKDGKKIYEIIGNHVWDR